MAVREQLEEINALLPPYGSQGSNAGIRLSSIFTLQAISLVPIFFCQLFYFVLSLSPRTLVGMC